jgi:hypothetical protein
MPICRKKNSGWKFTYVPTKLTSRSTTIDISKHALGGLSMFNLCDMMMNTPYNFFATNSNESLLILS